MIEGKERNEGFHTSSADLVVDTFVLLGIRNGLCESKSAVFALRELLNVLRLLELQCIAEYDIRKHKQALQVKQVSHLIGN